MIKVIICDDQAIILAGLEMLLKLEPDIEVVGRAKDGKEAIALTETQSPDLILMDLKMPGMNGVEATRRLRAQHPDVKVLILTTYDDDEWLFDAIRAGANGYLLKDSPRAEVIKAVRGTVEGMSFVDPAVAGKLLGQFAGEPMRPAANLTNKLTEREVDVLCLLAQGLSNADIAHQLFLSEGTVRNHVSTIYAKLDVADRTQAALLASRHGLHIHK